jgi:hypothetical protein
LRFDEFIFEYDKPGSIVLLAGKRNVQFEDGEKLIKLGILLVKKSKHILFRSGNAKGADSLFAKGVASIDPSRFQIVLPYNGHRKNFVQTNNILSLDNINLVSEPDVVYQSRGNRKTENLIDRYLSGESNSYAIKAAYIIRDTIQVIGTSEIQAANFGIVYDDLNAPMTGGTGHTMKICKQNNIAFIDQTVWFNWL